MKVLYDKSNTINHIQLDIGVEVSKHYFLKMFFLSFPASVRWNVFLFCDCANNPFSHYVVSFFCWVSLSLSSYAFQDDNFAAQFLINGRPQKVNIAIFLNWCLVWCFQIIYTLLFVLRKTFLSVVDLFSNWWYHSSCCN